MTYDPNLPHKCVDGVNINLTAQEIANHAALQSTWAAEAAAITFPIPDLATQLANLLIAKGTLAKTDIDSKTLIAVNAALAAAGQPTIK